MNAAGTYIQKINKGLPHKLVWLCDTTVKLWLLINTYNSHIYSYFRAGMWLGHCAVQTASLQIHTVQTEL